ncbi:similar to Tetrapisispora blattae hypothetical protein TBLA_0C01300 [Tetrapisispora blattae CBS 6284] [Maudiozyma saulgeensis]|uniref:Flavodoxin-like fold domain-containing protein n=1 Tax=Maudiozyma saulgeensis TaxID=1789683 RepID=A0A1X7RB10_9SACH|nr:similar to Tetrapisispora blattae hypothetical protein TBLA_0C01300 [Tetrapisispora blattae CBS 6284] [Kazachstania saulgeensis]
MKVLIIFAHPEKRSLQHSLLDVTVNALKRNGHEVKVSDLYNMNWKIAVDENDFLNHEKGTRLQPIRAAASAYDEGMFSNDITEEQEKVKWADLIIFQFPLWWYSMPAIMKGWMDRVLNKKFAFSKSGETLTGPLAGKKTFLITTVGASEEDFSEEGSLGDISHTLYPIQRGIFKFIGLDVLSPIIGYSADSRKPICFEKTSKLIEERIANISSN